MSKIIGEFCIVRCRDAGVHMGTVEAQSDRSCLLRDARRLWRWTERFTLNEVANHGAGEESRISEPVDTVLLVEICEVIPVVSQTAVANLKRSRNGE